MVVCTAQQKRSIKEHTSAQQPNTQLTTIPRLSHAPLSLYKADMGHGQAGCEPSGQHTTTTTERSIKAARIFYGQRCACMCKIPDILSGQWTQVSSTLADACSCEGRPHASDNTYSAVRLFPQANITDNTQTTRIQRCSSRTCTPIYPSMSAPICFRRAILR